MSAMCLRSTIGFWLFMAAPPGCVTGAFWSLLLRVPASTIPMPRLRTLQKWLLCIQLVLSAIIPSSMAISERGL